MAKLTTKQRLFVEAYVECGNATHAAQQAGYSKLTAFVQASQMLRQPVIQAAIQDRLRHAPESTQALFENRSLKKSSKYGIVYFLRADNGLVKIGWATDFEQRLKLLNRSLPYQLEVLFLFETEDAKRLERMFHNYFEQRRVRGKSEWFSLTTQDIEEAPIAAHHCNARRIQ